MQKDLYSLELFIAKLLRYGVLAAGFFMLLGWATQIQFSANPFLLFAHYHASSLAQSLSAAVRAGEWGLLMSYVGLFILIALPFFRVVMTAVLFFKQKEFVLAAIALFVTVALIVSFTLGFEI